MAQTKKKGTTVRRRLTSERPMKHRPPEKDAEEETKKPRQARLPQMDDPAIEELESAAESYADVRDQRQALTSQEVPLKEKLLGLMHSHGKTEYRHGGVEIKVLVEKEKVRVRIKKDKED